ncbi:prolyl oligopeptidase family serine peptidase [Pseudoalteromonas luteoviolacea]|uniref:alpha/beta hydrolase family protein n=1 Tax=Pseudoalteromonas luteoviolacea TaxID=43657 RepID=UPI001EED14ED|nr:prolyl oligopeptidase family serine peptidase [Pseudoalteromonas luteoviolacea]MCF6441041.1 prolyl oligopeptidase family serine peptidase [Pseudoalteromonas luteoviolacea]
MKFKSAVTLLFSAIATQLSAAPIDPQQIQFIGPIGQNIQTKPHHTGHQSAIVNTLINKLSADNASLEVFGERIKWQPLADVNALTMGGLQALKLEFSTTRFVQGKLTLAGIEKAHVFLNGQQIDGKSDYQLNAVTGDHQLLIVAEQVSDWKKVAVDFAGTAEHDQLNFTNKSTKALSAKQLFDAPTISAISVSPDANYYVATQQHYQDNKGNSALRDTVLYNEDGDIIYRLNGVRANAVNWRADSKVAVFVQNKQLKTLDVKTLKETAIAEDLDGASGFKYFNDNTLIFSWTKTAPKGDKIVKHYKGLEDRWSYARNITQVYLMDISTGLIQAVTEHELSHSLKDFDAKNNRILTTRSPKYYAAPAHYMTELVEFDLNTNSSKVLGQYGTFKDARYGNDGIYVTAGAEFGNGAGRTLDEGILSNNYDTQLFWMNTQGTDIKPLSKQFDPSIESFKVLNNGDLVLKAVDEDRKKLYLFDESKNKFKSLKTKMDVVDKYSVADKRSPVVIAAGTTASSPQKLVQLNVKNNRASTLWDSQPIAYKQAEIATLEEFNFTNSAGTEIKGRVYIPHGLDKNKQHPALIYYYGGTSPVSRGFTGRYPFNFWATNGYVVYVLQPSGATGFGQDFSAKHVNDWGNRAADDIIEGTNAFLDAYQFVDKKRLGNLGASYGGFMTMTLATKTDMFSASISHAGISNLTSYWGHGWWGYLYSAEASKHSYPWNNSKLYSQQSPVFNADKVKTPLLLIHGDADVNVPVGESHIMYTALKMLNQDVELIEYKGADHQIFARDRRFQWWDTMLAYFDKHLKDEPQWWQHMYGK